MKVVFVHLSPTRRSSRMTSPPSSRRDTCRRPRLPCWQRAASVDGFRPPSCPRSGGGGRSPPRRPWTSARSAAGFRRPWTARSGPRLHRPPPRRWVSWRTQVLENIRRTSLLRCLGMEGEDSGWGEEKRCETKQSCIVTNKGFAILLTAKKKKKMI